MIGLMFSDSVFLVYVAPTNSQGDSPKIQNLGYWTEFNTSLLRFFEVKYVHMNLAPEKVPFKRKYPRSLSTKVDNFSSC